MTTQKKDDDAVDADYEVVGARLKASPIKRGTSSKIIEFLISRY